MNESAPAPETESQPTTESAPAALPQSPPAWQPLNPVDRRVVGVLVEKAKTTPDAYPLSLNALRTGCNQKNNRDPEMQLTDADVQESLDRLRPLGAVEEVQGSGRVPRFRHHLYEWLGVDKVELAVMAELLLRGAQTEGELRGRAARMEPIADLAALRPIMTALKQRGLVISITPEGRGHVVSHALYPPEELEQVRAGFASGAPARESAPAPRRDSAELDNLRAELAQAQSELARMRREFEELNQRFHQGQEELERLKQSAGS